MRCMEVNRRREQCGSSIGTGPVGGGRPGYDIGPDQLTDVKIAVIGAGSWGTTVASMLAERFDTVLWARRSEVAEAISDHHENPAYLAGFTLAGSLEATTDHRRAADGRQLLVMAVPAQHMRGVAEQFATLVGPGVVMLSLTKGVELGTLCRPSEILAQVLGPRGQYRIGVLAGPNLALEVMAGQPAATVVAAPDTPTARWLQALLNSKRFRVYTSDDVIGCEIGGAVKNVIAIAAGVADGLGYGWNSRAALITRGLAELARLGVAMGGDPLTFLGLAGNGDLIATCSSDESRNHRVGVGLGQARALSDILTESNMVAEGVDSTPAVLALARRVGVEMPVAEQVGAMLTGVRSPEDAVQSLMRRGLTSELHDLGGSRLSRVADGRV
jgi:glycerol-3-phosphate dehydrogenase (NAD(P)+)